jgi:hypothetical protein
MKKVRSYLLPALFVWCACSAGGQERVRIAGLESNDTYRELLTREKNLTHTLDSVSRAMSGVREAFRLDTTNRRGLSNLILQIEEEMFEIRNRQARLVGQINSIEQDWILESLAQGAVTEEDVAPLEDEAAVANLVYNSYFGRNLSEADYRDLVGAQQKETAIPPLVTEYRDNHHRLSELSAAYNLAVEASTADSIKRSFDSLVNVNADLDRQIALAWSLVFDNKSYLYNLLADKNNRTDLLEQYSAELVKVRDGQAIWSGRYASDAIATYVLQKLLITDYEIVLARELGIEPALDSLQKVRSALPLIANLELGEVAPIKERLFIDYQDITRHASSPYNSAHPIPEVKVYSRGVVYRVLLGDFSSEQQPSIFRNVAPLAVEKGSDGRYRYFAGGFPSDSTVRAAVEQMRRVGFKKPEPVVWMDGIYVNLAAPTAAEGRFFRVEMSGVGELSDEVKTLIATLTDGVDILRAGENFVVGPLDDVGQTLRLRTALDGRQADLELKVVEIPSATP